MQPGITVDEAEESEATGRIRLIFRSLFFTTPYRRLSPRPREAWDFPPRLFHLTVPCINVSADRLLS